MASTLPSTETATATATAAPPLPHPNRPASTSPPSSQSAHSPPTAATSPTSSPSVDEAHSPHSPTHSFDASDEDDFFVPGSPPYSAVHPHSNTTDLPSDVPALRRTHVTNGYREGLAAAKDKSLQVGFDLGFPDGAAAGLKAGWILGVLEGLKRGDDGDRERVERVLKAARGTLGIREVVEVMEEKTEEETVGLNGDGEEGLVMEDVRVKGEVLGGWYEGTKRVVEGAVVG